MSSPIAPAALKRQMFEQVYTELRDELVEYVARQGMPGDATEWFSKSLMYNVPGGKLNRGLAVIDTVETLRACELTDEEFHQAAVLGWCVELLQAVFLVTDDLMDASTTRRGQPCWYRSEGVGLIAVNDALMLEAAIYWLLKKHFCGEPCYVHLLELFHETAFQTEIGQLLDLITAPEGKVGLSTFSLERHRLIVTYKTAYYSFYLPVALAMRLCGLSHEASYARARAVLLPLGAYFQAQDDVLDVAGAPAQTGKVGTDIGDGKCAWCVNAALAAATPAQRAVLQESYGRKDEGAEARVKAVFEEVGIRERYAAYEEQEVRRIMGLIETIPEEGLGGEGGVKLRRQVFTSFLDKIYKRQK